MSNFTRKDCVDCKGLYFGPTDQDRCNQCNLPSTQHEASSTHVVHENVDHSRGEVISERVYQDYETVLVQRPVEITERTVEVPVIKDVETYVPRIEVTETVKKVPKETPEYIDRAKEIPQKRVIDRYVEVPVIVGPPVDKYVPKIEVVERTVEVTKPTTKWVERVVEVPQIREVVRYVEHGEDVEQVIRYVPEGTMLAKGPPVGVDEKTGHTMYAAAEESEPSKPSESKPSSKGPKSKSESAVLDATERGAQTKVTSSTAKSESEDDSYDSTDVNVIRVEGETIKTTERPLTVVPVPFMVPKVVNVDVPVPIMKFDDHFVPVPIRRQIVPKMIFDDKNVYEVECNREKPILVVEERKKPVPVDVPIIIRETDVKVYPIDPHDLSQADMHAMWMRVNADLLDLYRETHAGLNPYGHPSEPKMLPNNFEESLIRQDEQENPAQPLPEGVDPEDPIPLHPGHPLLLPVLQNQWCHIPTTEMQNLYSPDYLRLYNQAMNAIQDPKPQQVNLSETQAARYQPSPDEQLPQPWVHVSDDQYRKMVERKDQAFQAAVEQATAAHFAEAEAEA